MKLPQEKRAQLAILMRELCNPFAGNSMDGDVLEFMVAFDQYPRQLDEPASEADLELINKLVFDAKSGELWEMLAGFEKFKQNQSLENLTEFVDGAIDSIYVIIWALLKLRVPVADCFGEVQRSNMAKLNDDGTYTKNESGKVQKPAGWTPPNLHTLLMTHFDPAIYTGNIRTGDKK